MGIEELRPNNNEAFRIKGIKSDSQAGEIVHSKPLKDAIAGIAPGSRQLNESEIEEHNVVKYKQEL